MKLTELHELAGKVSEKIGKYVSVDISCHAFTNGARDITYEFYYSGMKNTVCFLTAQTLKLHMENILNPAESEPVEVE